MVSFFLSSVLFLFDFCLGKASYIFFVTGEIESQLSGSKRFHILKSGEVKIGDKNWNLSQITFFHLFYIDFKTFVYLFIFICCFLGIVLYRFSKISFNCFLPIFRLGSSIK